MRALTIAVAAYGSILISGCSTVPQSPPAAGPPNVVLISIDGMRGDRAHFNGHHRQTTPNLDAFVKAAVHFPNSFSQSNESLLSHASMFTGLYPSEIGYPDYLKYIVPPGAQTIAEAMSANGYTTAGFTASGHVKERYGLAQGFDTFEEGPEFGSFQATVPSALNWLDQRQTDTPFFLFLHGYDCHRPYGKTGFFHHPFPDTQPIGKDLERALRGRMWSELIFDRVDYSLWFREDPEGLVVRHDNGERILNTELYTRLAMERGEIPTTHYRVLSEEVVEHLRAHYDAGILSADTYVGMFLQGLYEKGLWDNTIVIVTSDHGEDLQDHGYNNHRAVLFDSTTQVPLLIGGGALPEAHRGTVRSDYVQAIDLVRTISGIAGITTPATARGTDLWNRLDQASPNPARERVFQQGVMGQTSVRTSTHRLVFSGYTLTSDDYLNRLGLDPIDGGHFNLYTAKTGQKETEVPISDALQIANELRLELFVWMRDLARGEAAQTREPEVLKELRKRGYW